MQHQTELPRKPLAPTIVVSGRQHCSACRTATHCAVRSYPSRPVCPIAAFPAGGTSDIISRLVGEWLSERPVRNLAPLRHAARPGTGAS
jgi:tripartite-type tricarboxylate transporter receptor subunit TctC